MDILPKQTQLKTNIGNKNTELKIIDPTILSPLVNISNTIRNVITLANLDNLNRYFFILFSREQKRDNTNY